MPQLPFCPTRSHLSVCQAEHGGQLLSVRLRDILLYFKSLLQPFPLQVGEHRPRPRPFPLVRLWHRVFREDGVGPWKTQRGYAVGSRKENRNRRVHSLQVSRTSKQGARLGRPPVFHTPTYGGYLGRCPETDAGLIACCCCCCCLVNSSWRARRSSRGLWRRSTGWPVAERACGSLTDGSS